MKQNKGGVVSAVRKIAEPLCEELGYILWDVEYVKVGSEYYLRLTIDHENGITIEDCEKVHRAIDPLLDEADPIEGAYHLEVSSPGIERELKTDAHIEACVGWDVEIKLYAPLDGAKSYTGILLGLDEEEKYIGLELPSGEEKVFPREAVAQIRTRYTFD